MFLYATRLFNTILVMFRLFNKDLISSKDKVNPVKNSPFGKEMTKLRYKWKYCNLTITYSSLYSLNLLKE